MIAPPLLRVLDDLGADVFAEPRGEVPPGAVARGFVRRGRFDLDKRAKVGEERFEVPVNRRAETGHRIPPSRCSGIHLLAEAAQFVEVGAGHRAAPLFEGVDELHQPLVERGLEPVDAGHLHHRPDLVIHLGAAAPDGQVAPHPALLLEGVAVELGEPVEASVDRGPVAGRGGAHRVRIVAVEPFAANAPTVRAAPSRPAMTFSFSPFCIETTKLSGPSSGATGSSAAAVCIAFTASSTASGGRPRRASASPATVTAGTRTRNVVRPSMI